MGNKLCHSGHRERLRKRYLEFSASNFHEHELLELILFYGIPRKNTNEIAHDLIEEFGDISNVLNADKKELIKIAGIGNSAAEFLKLLGDVCQEYKNFATAAHSAMSAEDYPEYFREYFKDTAEGICLILCPDTNYKIMFSKETVLNGTADLVHIMNELVRKEYNKVIIGINRTNSAASPEPDDVKLADILSEKLSLLGIVLSDFLIIGKKRSYSLLYDGAFIF